MERIQLCWFVPDDAEGASYSAKAGYPKYEDVNKDGAFTADGLQDHREPEPKFTWGLNTTMKYKKFDLAIFFRGVQGNQVRKLTAIRNR